MSGRVLVVDRGPERHLVIDGSVMSTYPRDGDWGRLHREYWWQALVTVRLPPRPSVLLLGLGGGTQIHLLHQLVRPRLITVVERDPTIVRIATRWFGLASLDNLQFLCDAVERVVPWLQRVRRRFDFVMDDVAYAAPLEQSVALGVALVPLIAPGGVLVLNRHGRRDAAALLPVFERAFEEVRVRRVRREAENVLVCCSGRRPAGGSRIIEERHGLAAALPNRL